MHLAVIKSFDVAEVELCDWKLAVLFWVVVLPASCLYAYWTPTPARKVFHVVLKHLLWCWFAWVLVLLSLLFLVVVLHLLVRVV